ncbi:MAG: DUF6879 family protein [Candidatus Andersenbacteria bacterium]
MKTLEREKSFKLWDQWWNEMQDEWFKIEVLQDYSGEDKGPSLDAWLTGDKEKSIQLMVDDYNKEWVKMCQKSPAAKRRFHVVRKPYTPYLEWEIELYKRVNIPLAGEIVHLVPAEKVEHLNIPDGDVMIFDQKRVARAYYTPEGKVEKMDFYEKSTDDISSFLHIRAELPKHAALVVTTRK